ncbi:MAG TPA: type II toxin-antitoxin system death-on-curing family toxin [Vitreimonas sp.]|uniref:type II toxin-antitoxin system death-on-curing family toxin n=1 Tax=Vitreimonas sp. TaxID=3069702 RepID=UPI002D5D3436|nr:type II toxin-antitoxin system death-on-curing family toxin [Vitreimonas sp.]HYD87886.1 type II toxin-antitoxin system death-on-curing family toxin [Vitreimonas sp.]
MNTEPKWLGVDSVLIMHEEQIAEHGGASGIRDFGLLDSALARPRNAWSYGQDDLVALAALYAAGIMRNHPFVDGNKRTGFLAAYSFLYVNGLEIVASEAEVIVQCVSLAAGEIDDAEFAAWLHENVQAR